MPTETVDYATQRKHDHVRLLRHHAMWYWFGREDEANANGGKHSTHGTSFANHYGSMAMMHEEELCSHLASIQAAYFDFLKLTGEGQVSAGERALKLLTDNGYGY